MSKQSCSSLTSAKLQVRLDTSLSFRGKLAAPGTMSCDINCWSAQPCWWLQDPQDIPGLFCSEICLIWRSGKLCCAASRSFFQLALKTVSSLKVQIFQVWELFKVEYGRAGLDLHYFLTLAFLSSLFIILNTLLMETFPGLLLGFSFLLWWETFLCQNTAMTWWLKFAKSLCFYDNLIISAKRDPFIFIAK